MAVPRGHFDPALVPRGWFDEDAASDVSEFDRTLSDAAAASGSPATVPLAPVSAGTAIAAGKATGAALVGLAAVTASTSVAAGKATGAAKVGLAAVTAGASVAAGKATGAAKVGIAAVTAGESVAAGKATGAALVGLAAVAAASAAAAGKATGAAIVGLAAVTAAESVAPGSAVVVEPQAATVPLAPVQAATEIGPVRAFETREIIIVSGKPKPKKPKRHKTKHDPPLLVLSATVQLSPVTAQASVAQASARGDRSASVALASVQARTSVVPFGATGEARVLMRAATATTKVASVPAVGYLGPTEEEITTALLSLDFEKRKTINRDRHVVLTAQARIRSKMERFLRDLGQHVAMIARGRAHKVEKANQGKSAEEYAVNNASWDALRRDLTPELESVATDAVLEGLDLIDVEGLDAILHQANPVAVEWARERGAELVTAIDETTREGVARLVERAESEGWSNDDLADALLGAGVFDDSRADTIARTETAMADVEGNLIAWRASGVVVARQFVVSQDEVCDACAPYDGMVVPLDEDFPEGDPPIHPNCRCDVVPVLDDDTEADA